MNIYKKDEVIKKIKEDLSRRIEDIGITYEQLDILFAVAEADSGLKIEALRFSNGAYTCNGDIVRYTKYSAIKNILEDVYKINIDYDRVIINKVFEALKLKLILTSWERTKQSYDKICMYVHQCLIDTEISIEQINDIYIICIDEDGFFDVVDRIDTSLSVFGMIRLTEKDIKENEKLLNAIKETGAKITF